MRVVAVLTALAAGAPSTRAGTIGVPVLLVPGWFDTGRDLAALRIRLISAGWAAESVRALTFANPTGSNRPHALEIAAAVESLARDSGVNRIDIVAHSMGGLAVREYLRTTGGAAVRRVVFLATPHHGTWSAMVAFGEGRGEMLPGSDFLDTLNAAPPVPAGVDALTVRTPLDAHILPGESAILPGIVDRQVCCPTHAGLLQDLEVFRIVRRFLDEGDVEEEGP